MQIENKIDNQLNIGGVLKFSILDFPGKLSAVIFCQGCPNRCVYCHNPEFIPEKKKSTISFDEVLNILKTRQGLLDAVVFSGGEPLMQEGLYDALCAVKEMGFRIGIHTSGYYPEQLSDVINLIDWVGFDIKTVFNKYKIITQNDISGEMAEKSFEILLRSTISYEVRTTLDSRLITFEDLKQIAYMLKEKGVPKWVLQECILRAEGNAQKLNMISDEELKILNAIISVEIRKQ
ncbi:MAG: anaerobic ribonucleoside-triphosphate reductase activating protein [Alphaproteobacteria bacterium]|nr:anaerobic ribonucleoside-triphosphate reductase activating protein [Alphaproteobacteria bacterium]